LRGLNALSAQTCALAVELVLLELVPLVLVPLELVAPGVDFPAPRAFWVIVVRSALTSYMTEAPALVPTTS
jgi:hypothetical protein